MELKTAAGTAGRVCGTAWRGLQWANQRIDWQEVAAIVGHGLVALVVLVYCAGFELGRAVHRADDALAGLWRQLWVPQDVADVPAEKAATRRPVVVAPMVHPLAALAEELESLSCRELRRLSGVRAKRSKVWLVGAVCAV
jgi:hypothetical protein